MEVLKRTTHLHPDGADSPRGGDACHPQASLVTGVTEGPRRGLFVPLRDFLLRLSEPRGLAN